MDDFESVTKIINARKPKYLKAIVLKEFYGLSVEEIARLMDDSERNIRYYISEAVRIGRQYKQENE